jgi:hypothetical protein
MSLLLMLHIYTILARYDRPANFLASAAISFARARCLKSMLRRYTKKTIQMIVYAANKDFIFFSLVRSVDNDQQEKQTTHFISSICW